MPHVAVALYALTLVHKLQSSIRSGWKDNQLPYSISNFLDEERLFLRKVCGQLAKTTLAHSKQPDRASIFSASIRRY